MNGSLNRVIRTLMVAAILAVAFLGAFEAAGGTHTPVVAADSNDPSPTVTGN